MRLTRKPLALLFIAGVAAVATWAQSPPGPVTPTPGQPIQQAPATPPLKLRVALVDLPVTVRDAKGKLVDSLAAEDFRITDRGVEQKILHFDLGGDPISLVILVETSSRIDSLLPGLRKTGIVLTQAVMGQDGEAAVVGFNDAVDKLQDFTPNADAIEKTVGTLQSGTDGLKLYDAMAVGIEMLSGRPQPSAEHVGHRRVMLVLSETIDVGSEKKLGEVLRQAQLANVTICSVGLSTLRTELQGKPLHTQPGPMSPPGIITLPPQPGTIQTPTTEAARTGTIDLMGAAIWAVQHVNDQVKDHAMDVAAAATAGSHLSTFKNRSVEDAIDQIGGELHSQYSITYAPTDGNDLGYHEIKVQVKGKGLRVRTRPGYYVAPPEN